MYSIIEKPENRINFSGTGISTTNNLEIPLDTVIVPEEFQMDSPYNILFYTYHTLDNVPQLIMYQSTPQQAMYSVCEGEEANQIISLSSLHRHNYYELLFVIDGKIYQNIEHTRHLYPKGSCCLLNKNVYHTEEYSGDHRICFLQFSAEMVSSLLSFPRYFQEEDNRIYAQIREFFQTELTHDLSNQKNYIDFIPLESECWVREHVHQLFEKILTETGHPSGSSSLRISAYIMELFCCLFDKQHYQHTPIHFGSQKERKLFNSITYYLKENHGRMNRRELENVLNYSGDYLYKIVQKYTGLSLFSYGMHFCLKEAADLLSTTSLPVNEIARKLKFSNTTHFYKLFEEQYHMTPREYRNSTK